MTKLQFRVLYREFLFRMVDLELLSAQGDISKLLGQFAGLLIFISSVQALGALLFDGRRMSPSALVIFFWRQEHSLIAMTMVVVGLFAVLSWDSMFPDRRDVLVLAPLPIRTRTLFLAKVAALATALSLTVVALNVFTGLVWPCRLVPANGGLLDLILSLALYRSLAAYWITMLSAGAFIFCSVLTVQGLAGLLPRRRFLRVSAFLQMAAFCLLVSVYFLQPSLATPKALSAAENQRLLAWLPSYWFLGLFQALNGSMHPAMVPLARRAWMGLAIAGFGAGTAFLLSYFRTLRRIVEEPDIVPGSHGLKWSPRFGNSLETAIVLFSIRTLLRSRQHRVVLAFYLGIGFAIVLLFIKTPRAQQQLLADNMTLLFSSVVMMCFCVVGTRVVFSIPLDLRANWIFRITEVRGMREYLAAIRRPLFVLAVAPVWAASAALLLSIWPWRLAAGHLPVLGLWGMILAYLCLHGFQKIPFTCSYLPGKSYVHMVVLCSMGILLLILKGVEFERRALGDLGGYARMLLVLCIAAGCARWRTGALAAEGAALQFEETAPEEVFVLGLYRDGVLAIEAKTVGPAG
jgi:hypothetical protein